MEQIHGGDSNSGGGGGGSSRNDEISVTRASRFDALPEDCISKVISHTSPRDACVVASVSKSVKSAAQSDLVWEMFLPSEYSSLVLQSANHLSKKEIFLSLADNSVLVENGKKSFWVEKASGKKCYMLSAMELTIIWGDSPAYWKWITVPESKFEKVAELRNVCWFEVRGKISCGMLSKGTHYSVYVVFKTANGRSYGFDLVPVEAGVGFVGKVATKKSVYFESGNADSRSATSHYSGISYAMVSRAFRMRRPWMQVQREEEECKMGSSYQESPPLLLEDLKVTIKESTLIFPSEETSERKSMFLSNVDQILNFDVQTVHFFRPNKEFPPEMVSEKLRKALVKLMDAYEFLAGRLRVDPSSGRLDVDCNGAGAGFVTAASDYTLEELGDLVYPNPAFAQLVTSQLQSLPKDDQPLFVFQITSFKCGGFAMGISTNHTTFDGLSFKTFLENLASLLHEKPLSTPPCNDRTLLKARDPPSVAFPHHELVKFQDCETTTVFEATSEHLDFKIFKLSSEQIKKLKERASETSNGNVRVTGFNVVTALVWRCKALSVAAEEGEETNLERESTILYAVDIRGRLNPELPPSYTGNAVLTAYAKEKCKALLEEPFGRIVEMVGEGSKRITDEYARSAIDWGELYKGFPHGEVLVSSWWKLGFAEVEYPWGKPKYSCPVVYHRKDIVLLFPDIDGDSKGVYVLAALPSKEMSKFQHWFEDTLC